MVVNSQICQLLLQLGHSAVMLTTIKQVVTVNVATQARQLSVAIGADQALTPTLGLLLTK
jgi:hypothetical protein